MTRFFAVLSLLLLAAVLLTGCITPDQKPNTQTTAAETGTASPSDTAASAPTETDTSSAGGSVETSDTAEPTPEFPNDPDDEYSKRY